MFETGGRDMEIFCGPSRYSHIYTPSAWDSTSVEEITDENKGAAGDDSF
jgi:hypothetical protein